MSRLQSAADYRRAIAEATAMLELEHQMAEEYGRDAASELAVLSWQNRIAALEQELAELGDDKLPTQELSLRYEGKPVKGHSIEVPFFATALRNFQTVVTAAVGSAVGRMARSGRFHEALRAQATLRVTESFQGSFGVHLETSGEQLEFDQTSFVAEAVRNVIDLLSVDDAEDIVTALQPFDARAIVNYQRMLNHLKANRAEMALRWHSVEGDREVRISAKQAERISQRLSQFKRTEERTVWHSGVLDGAIKTQGFFQFISNGGETFNGSVAKSTLDRLRDYYDRACEAFISTVRMTDSVTGETKTWHQLEDLRPIDADPASSDGD
jgi:hypothetical protein